MISNPPESIELYCRAAQEYKASDLILHAGEPPVVRVSGSITPMEAPPLNAADLRAFRECCGVPDSSSDHDASFVSAQGIRFRVNFHRSLGQDAAVLRRISSTPPDIDQLGLPSGLLKEMASRKSGILIVSGPTGSGKSTTLASVLEWVNCNLERHIVTVEDPVEFVFERKQSLFTQRAVGLDTASFAEVAPFAFGGQFRRLERVCTPTYIEVSDHRFELLHVAALIAIMLLHYHIHNIFQ